MIGGYDLEPGNDKNRALIENHPDAFAYHKLVSDNEGEPVDYIFLDVNPAFEEMTGFPRDEIIGNKITEVHPEMEILNFDWMAVYAKVALKGETLSFEQYSELLERWFVVTAYSDEPEYFAVIFKDITDSKEKEIKEEAARKSQQLAQSILDSMNSNICVLDDQGYIIAVNQAWFNFAVSNGGNIVNVRPGINYLELCDKAQGEEREMAKSFAAGIRELIRGERDYFYMGYPCDAPAKKLWFLC